MLILVTNTPNLVALNIPVTRIPLTPEKPEHDGVKHDTFTRRNAFEMQPVT